MCLYINIPDLLDTCNIPTAISTYFKVMRVHSKTLKQKGPKQYLILSYHRCLFNLYSLALATARKKQGDLTSPPENIQQK